VSSFDGAKDVAERVRKALDYGRHEWGLSPRVLMQVLELVLATEDDDAVAEEYYEEEDEGDGPTLTADDLPDGGDDG